MVKILGTKRLEKWIHDNKYTHWPLCRPGQSDSNTSCTWGSWGGQVILHGQLWILQWGCSSHALWCVYLCRCFPQFVPSREICWYLWWQINEAETILQLLMFLNKSWENIWLSAQTIYTIVYSSLCHKPRTIIPFIILLIPLKKIQWITQIWWLMHPVRVISFFTAHSGE